MSGRDVFVLVPIRFPKRHQEHFDAIRQFIAQRKCRIDSACRNVSRLRRCTHGPELYINPAAEPFTKWCKLSKAESRKDDPVQTNRNMEVLLPKIKETGTDITERYKQWFRVGCALASEFGEKGLDYFHRIIRQNPDRYSYRECDAQYTKCLTSDRITIATFFHRCKAGGIRLK